MRFQGNGPIVWREFSVLATLITLMQWSPAVRTVEATMIIAAYFFLVIREIPASRQRPASPAGRCTRMHGLAWESIGHPRIATTPSNGSLIPLSGCSRFLTHPVDRVSCDLKIKARKQGLARARPRAQR